MNMNFSSEVMMDLRSQIDEQDEIIVEAIKKRYEIVDKVKEHKTKHVTSKIDLVLDMNREFNMIKHIQGKNKINKDLVFAVWRTFISFANQHEQKIDIITLDPDIQAKMSSFYPSGCQKITTGNMENIVNAENAIVAGFSLKSKDKWWYKIFVEAKLPQDNFRIFNVIDDVAFAGYINDTSLVKNYNLYILKNIPNVDFVKIDSHKDLHLIATKNTIQNAMLIGMIPEISNNN